VDDSGSRLVLVDLGLLTTERFCLRTLTTDLPAYAPAPLNLPSPEVQSTGRVDDTARRELIAVDLALETGLGRAGYDRLLSVLQVPNWESVVPRLRAYLLLGWTLDAFELAQILRGYWECNKDWICGRGDQAPLDWDTALGVAECLTGYPEAEELETAIERLFENWSEWDRRGPCGSFRSWLKRWANAAESHRLGLASPSDPYPSIPI